MICRWTSDQLNQQQQPTSDSLPCNNIMEASYTVADVNQQGSTMDEQQQQDQASYPSLKYVTPMTTSPSVLEGQVTSHQTTHHIHGSPVITETRQVTSNATNLMSYATSGTPSEYGSRISTYLPSNYQTQPIYQGQRQYQQQYVNAPSYQVSYEMGDTTSNAQTIQTQTIQSEAQQRQFASSGFSTSSRVVTGEERIIGYNKIVGEDKIISEKIVEHEIRVPKKIIREEIIEKTITVPETIFREEIVEDVQLIKQTIVEVAKPVIMEKIIEIPEIEYRWKIVEKVQKVLQEKFTHVPKIELQEKIIEVPKLIVVEKPVEVPQVEYRDVFTDKLIEVPEIQEKIVYKTIQIPQYVAAEEITHHVPFPVEAITTFEYQLSQFRPRVNKVQYPLYVPRFVEVPVSAELFDQARVSMMQTRASKLAILNSAQAAGLCEVENLATEFRQDQPLGDLNIDATQFQEMMTDAWKNARIPISGLNTRSSAAVSLL